MTGGTSCHHLTADDDDHDDDWNEDYDQDDGVDGVDQHVHFLNQCYAMKGNMTHTLSLQQDLKIAQFSLFSVRQSVLAGHLPTVPVTALNAGTPRVSTRRLLTTV